VASSTDLTRPSRRVSLKAVEGALRLLTQGLAVLGGGLVGVMMLAMVTDVALRHFANRPLPQLIALSEVGLSVVVYCGLAYTYMTKRHVSADFLRSRVQGAAAYLLALARTAASLVITLWFTYACWQATSMAMEYDERHRTFSDLVLWPIRGFITVGVTLMALLILLDLLDLTRTRKHQKSSPERTGEANSTESIQV
jgi:TRAP-type C4-dicarboxylate transport system permease small subunit